MFALLFVFNYFDVFLLVNVGLLQKNDIDILGHHPLEDIFPFFVVM